MSDTRPDRVYGILVREGRVFVRLVPGGGLGLPGGAFRPLAEDRKVEVRAYLLDQIGVDAPVLWAQGAFAYRDAAEAEPAFCGFYTAWDWDGAIPEGAGAWLDKEAVLEAPLPASLRTLLYSVLDTVAIRTR